VRPWSLGAKVYPLDSKFSLQAKSFKLAEKESCHMNASKSSCVNEIFSNRRGICGAASTKGHLATEDVITKYLYFFLLSRKDVDIK